MEKKPDRSETQKSMKARLFIMSKTEVQEAYTGELQEKKQIIIEAIEKSNNLHWIRCIYAYVTKLLGK